MRTLKLNLPRLATTLTLEKKVQLMMMEEKKMTMIPKRRKNIRRRRVNEDPEPDSESVLALALLV